MDKVKAALIYGPLDVRVIDVPKPKVGKGEVLARIKMCLTSGTTVKRYSKPYLGLGYPTGFGYEWVGIIEEVGKEVDSSLKGKRCITDFSAYLCARPCRCFFCLRGQPNLCAIKPSKRTIKRSDDPERGIVSGKFKEYDKLPAKYIKIIPEHVSDVNACQIPYVSFVLHGINKVKIDYGDTVATVGSGAIGIIHMLLAHLRGAQTIAIDKNQDRLEFAKKIGAADYTINSSSIEEIKKKFKQLNINEGFGPDVVIESVGMPATYEEAFQLVRSGGQVLMFGGAEKGTKVNLDTFHLHYDEVTIVSSVDLYPIDFERSYKLIEKGMLNLNSLVTTNYSLHNIKEALEKHRQQKGMKYAVIP
jgi:threonine dehydrogenase-like Zn-dependent dehydrogenase